MTTAIAEAGMAELIDLAAIDKLRATYLSNKTKSYDWRHGQLTALLRMLDEEGEAIEASMREDLGKCAFEAVTGDIAFVKAETKYIRKRLRKWMKPRRVATAMLIQPGRSRVVPEPLGVVLIISAWNYQYQLSLGPLAAAIAAGNCAVIKPSEVAEATSHLLAKLVPRYLDTSAFMVVEGGIPETTELLAQPWDKILYTGNGNVGRIVMRAAAEHLTPVTLELGGKSPVIIDSSADIELAAKRTIWAKTYNAGQSCTAPDYVLVEKGVQDAFISACKKTLDVFYPDGAQKSPDYARIINERHFERILKLLEGHTPVSGGGNDRTDRFIEPTILKDVDAASPVMSEEIFGPLLPVLGVKDVGEAIAFIKSRPKPLAIYAFSADAAVLDRITHETSSGGMTLNACMLHPTNPSMPFGGVGESGMGAYHGKAGFDDFSHFKSVLKKATLSDPSFIYPPYSAKIVNLIRKFG